MKKNNWSKDEVELLKKEYGRKPAEEIAAETGRSVKSVYNKANYMGLSDAERAHAVMSERYGYQRFSDEEIAYVKSYLDQTYKQIGEAIGRCPQSVHKLCKRNGFIPLRKNRAWTDEDDAELERLYARKSNKQLAKEMVRSESAIRNRAVQLGITMHSGMYLTTSDLAGIFNVDMTTVRRWHTRDGLRIINSQWNKKSGYLFKESTFWHWAESHKDRIPWDHYVQGTLLEEPEWVRNEPVIKGW